MKTRFLAKGIFIILCLAVAVAGTAHAAGLTAKASLKKVIAAGKKWHGDAVLVSLSSVTVRPDGTAKNWKYSFYSPSTKERCVITADSSGVRTKNVRLGFSTEPLGEFIDSDKAMSAAKKEGLKGNEPVMGVKHLGSGKKESVYWVVDGGFAKGDISVILVAKTGKFFSRNVME